jgi:hypothetical protein
MLENALKRFSPAVSASGSTERSTERSRQRLAEVSRRAGLVNHVKLDQPISSSLLTDAGLEAETLSASSMENTDLFDFCFIEIHQNLTIIQKTLEQVELVADDEPSASFRKSFRTVLRAVQAIQDLAMVHGHQEIESVAHKTEMIVQQGLRAGAAAVASLRPQLQKTVEIIRELAQTSDEGDAEIMARKATEEIDSFIVEDEHFRSEDDLEHRVAHGGRHDESDTTDSSPTLADTAAAASAPSAMVADGENEPALGVSAREIDESLFDIREPDIVTDQVADETDVEMASPATALSENETATKDQKSEEPPDAKPWEPSAEDERRAEQRIEEIFSEILVAQIREHLDKIIVNLKRLQFQQHVPESIREIQSCCQTLLQLGEKAQNPRLNEILVLMNRLAQERLREDGISTELLAAFRAGQKFVRWCLEHEMAGLSFPGHQAPGEGFGNQHGAGETTTTSQGLLPSNHANPEFELVRAQLARCLRNDETSPEGESTFGNNQAHQANESCLSYESERSNGGAGSSGVSHPVHEIPPPDFSTSMPDEDPSFPEESHHGGMKIELISKDELEGAPIKFSFDFHDVEDDPLPPPKLPFIQRLKKFFGMR